MFDLCHRSRNITAVCKCVTSSLIKYLKTFVTKIEQAVFSLTLYCRLKIQAQDVTVSNCVKIFILEAEEALLIDILNSSKLSSYV